MTINATASILLALYIAVAEEQGVDTRKLSGTVQNDILKEYIARGTYIYPPAALDAHHHRHLRLLRRRSAELEHDQHQRLPHPRGGLDRRRRRSPSRSPTASPTCEAARATRPGRRRVRGRGSRFFFNGHNNFFEEVAKFRAARRMWARIMRERFGAKDPRSLHAALPHADRWLDPHRPAAR